MIRHLRTRYWVGLIGLVLIAVILTVIDGHIYRPAGCDGVAHIVELDRADRLLVIRQGC